ncbi:MAG: hypothetical protein ABI867_09900 [Kofleriaceae bacterium]
MADRSKTAANAALADFLAGKPVDIGQTLGTLPAGADVELAVMAVMRLVDHPHHLAASCAVLPVAVIRGVLADSQPSSSHLFLRLAVPLDEPAKIRRAWKAAVTALRDLYDSKDAWESGKRAKLAAKLARDPRVLAGLQGLVANAAATDVTLEMLAVLAIDGSDTSVDALIPHLDPALGARTARLERLAQLRTCAKRTPALDTLFAEVDSAVVEYRKSSPALALATAIGGLGSLDVLWFQFMLMSVEATPRIPRVQGNVRIDSRETPWFTVWVSRVHDSTERTRDRETRFDDTHVVEDALEIGSCTASDLPAWLAVTAKRLYIEWQPFLVRTSADAKRLGAWLIAT